MPVQNTSSHPSHSPSRRSHRRRTPRWRLPLLAAAAAVCVCLLVIPSRGGSAPAVPPVSSASPRPAATQPQQPTPAPLPTGTPQSDVPPESAFPGESAPPAATEDLAVPTDPAGKSTDQAEVVPFDFSASAPETAAVEMDYFSDALFIGDSRTDGLRLYSGIQGADFYCYKGLTIFEMDSRKVVTLEDGGSYTVLEALEKGKQYGKIYISLGINELGYFNDDAFHNTFRDFLSQVKALQPDAIIYLENLVPVNPDKCAANKQPYYVNNDRVAAYNAIYPQLAQEEQVVLLDVASALSDENGILPADATADGVHFTKDHYKSWLAYLMCHTVDPDAYAAGQSTQEGVEET